MTQFFKFREYHEDVGYGVGVYGGWVDATETELWCSSSIMVIY